MAVYSGKDATTSAGSHVTSWSASVTSNNSAWASSETNGFKDRVAGVKEATCSIEGKFDASASFVPGTEYSLTLTASTGSIAGNFLCDSYSVEVDINDGEVVGYSAEFSSNGAITVS